MLLSQTMPGIPAVQNMATELERFVAQTHNMHNGGSNPHRRCSPEHHRQDCERAHGRLSNMRRSMGAEARAGETLNSCATGGRGKGSGCNIRGDILRHFSQAASAVAQAMTMFQSKVVEIAATQVSRVTVNYSGIKHRIRLEG